MRVPASLAAACSAPRAKMSRLVARWISSMRSPGAANCTRCSPTMSPARSDWRSAAAHRPAPRWHPAPAPCPRARPSCARGAIRRCRSPSPAAPRAARSTSSLEHRHAEAEVGRPQQRDALRGGVQRGALRFAPARWCRTPAPRRAATHSARIGSKPSGRLKSMATSNAGTPDSSAAAKCGTPSTTRCAGCERDTRRDHDSRRARRPGAAGPGPCARRRRGSGCGWGMWYRSCAQANRCAATRTSATTREAERGMPAPRSADAYWYTTWAFRLVITFCMNAL